MFVISRRWQSDAPDVAPAQTCVCVFAFALMRLRARMRIEQLSLREFWADGQEDATSYCLTTMNL